MDRMHEAVLPGRSWRNEKGLVARPTGNHRNDHRRNRCHVFLWSLPGINRLRSEQCIGESAWVLPTSRRVADEWANFGTSFTRTPGSSAKLRKAFAAGSKRLVWKMKSIT